MDSELTEILKDKSSGSVELLLRLNNYLMGKLDHPSELKEIIPLLRRELSAFAAVRNYLDRVSIPVGNDDIEGFRIIADSFTEQQSSVYSRMYLNARPFLADVNNIITISNSLTLFEIFKQCRTDNPALNVFIMESRPAEEGKIMAARLTDAGISVQLITDAQAGYYIRHADAAMSGADQLLDNGDIVNKTGTNLLAVAAKFYGKPFYVLASNDKKTDSTVYMPEFKPAGEIWEEKPSSVKTENFYFETVSSSLITKIITDGNT